MMASQIFPLTYHNCQEVGVAVESYEVGLRPPVVFSDLPLSYHYRHCCLQSSGLSPWLCSVCLPCQDAEDGLH